MNYKGNKASKQAMHRYLYAHYGKPTFCYNENCEGKSTMYEWCLRTGRKYSNNPKDYLWLCRKCHRNYDMTAEKRMKAINNLWWNTGKKQNNAKGGNVAQSKLTVEQVLKIREEAKKEGFVKRHCAKKYGVDPMTIRHILTRTTWKHI